MISSRKLLVAITHPRKRSCLQATYTMRKEEHSPPSRSKSALEPGAVCDSDSSEQLKEGAFRV